MLIHNQYFENSDKNVEITPCFSYFHIIVYYLKILKVNSTDLEKLCGNKMWVFTCSTVVDGMEKVFELKYDLDGVLMDAF